MLQKIAAKIRHIILGYLWLCVPVGVSSRVISSATMQYQKMPDHPEGDDCRRITHSDLRITLFNNLVVMLRSKEFVFVRNSTW
jgi:hypothetical protein